MRHASFRLQYLLHPLLTFIVKSVTGAPILSHVLHKRAFAEGLAGGAITGYLVAIIALVILSGITAGLTLGLMSLDETQRKMHVKQC